MDSNYQTLINLIIKQKEKAIRNARLANEQSQPISETMTLDKVLKYIDAMEDYVFDNIDGGILNDNQLINVDNMFLKLNGMYSKLIKNLDPLTIKQYNSKILKALEEINLSLITKPPQMTEFYNEFLYDDDYDIDETQPVFKIYDELGKKFPHKKQIIDELYTTYSKMLDPIVQDVLRGRDYTIDGKMISDVLSYYKNKIRTIVGSEDADLMVRVTKEMKDVLKKTEERVADKKIEIRKKQANNTNWDRVMDIGAELEDYYSEYYPIDSDEESSVEDFTEMSTITENGEDEEEDIIIREPPLPKYLIPNNEENEEDEEDKEDEEEYEDEEIETYSIPTTTKSSKKSTSSKKSNVPSIPSVSSLTSETLSQLEKITPSKKSKLDKIRKEIDYLDEQIDINVKRMRSPAISEAEMKKLKEENLDLKEMMDELVSQEIDLMYASGVSYAGYVGLLPEQLQKQRLKAWKPYAKNEQKQVKEMKKSIKYEKDGAYDGKNRKTEKGGRTKKGGVIHTIPKFIKARNNGTLNNYLYKIRDTHDIHNDMRYEDKDEELLNDNQKKQMWTFKQLNKTPQTKLKRQDDEIDSRATKKMEKLAEKTERTRAEALKEKQRPYGKAYKQNIMNDYLDNKHSDMYIDEINDPKRQKPLEARVFDVEENEQNKRPTIKKAGKFKKENIKCSNQKLKNL